MLRRSLGEMEVLVSADHLKRTSPRSKTMLVNFVDEAMGENGREGAVARWAKGHDKREEYGAVEIGRT